MTRGEAIDRATEQFDSGAFRAELALRIAYRTESADPASGPALADYLHREIGAAITALGGEYRIVENPVAGGGPFLIGHRHEGADLPTVLVYGHGDVVTGDAASWRDGLDPWELRVEGDRWYGRGTADNKGQHSVNLAALREVLRARGGALGFNLTVLMEAGEEVGSPGLHEVCARYRDELAADLLIASDGPRFSATRPTVFLGSRGAAHFTLRVTRDGGARHSGNWGGLLANPATVLASAVASIVDGRGRILVDELRPREIPDSVVRALDGLTIDRLPGDPAIDPGWGEPGLAPVQRLLAWNTIEVLAYTSGSPARPVSAIPASAEAHCQLRFVVGTGWEKLDTILRRHLDEHGFRDVEIEIGPGAAATRVDPDHPLVTWATDSVHRTTSTRPDLLPNFGGTLPNDAFADVLGMPTIWIPHSYPGCNQHAPDEHLRADIVREGLRIMAGIFWDLGELPAHITR